MTPSAYQQMADTEATHWWHVARRAILEDVIGRYCPRATPLNILEIGCGTGGNLEMLGKFGEVSAIELDESARAIALQKTRHRFDIRSGSCPDEIPFGTERFDLICIFDVLEHIENDLATLVSLRRFLATNGRIILTVPAYQWLFGDHDEYLHHKRRYAMRTLEGQIQTAGFTILRTSYFNTLLSPIAIAVRLKEKFFGRSKHPNWNAPSRTLNSFLRTVFGAERHLLRYANLPFGISIFCVLSPNPSVESPEILPITDNPTLQAKR